MCISMLRFIAYGWIDEFFVTPTFHFKYWGFAWVEPLPRPGMHALFWVLAGLALLIALGFCFRVRARRCSRSASPTCSSSTSRRT